MVDVSFFSIMILFLLIIFVSIIMYFKSEDDIWFQALWAITGFTTFLFMIPYAYFSAQVQMDMAVDLDIVAIDDVDINDFVIVGAESFTSSTQFFVYRFENINHDCEHEYKDARFCFYYNNSDNSPNVLRVSNSVVPISDYIYIANNSFGFKCAHINSSFVRSSSILGLGCEDCSVPNPLGIPKANGTDVEEIHITRNDPTTYSLQIEKPHIYWLELQKTPKKLANDVFVVFIFWLGFLVLGFGLRGVIMVIVLSKDVMFK